MRRILCLLPMLLGLALPAHAQQHYKIGKVIFKNPGPYTQQALTAASGLQPGTPLTDADLQKAAQTLMNTGLFDDAQGTLDGPMAAINVIFTLKPTPDSQLLPARFDNFIWADDDALLTELQRSAPLFRGYVPEAGNFADQVAAALVSAAAAHGASAPQSTRETIEPTSADPVRHITYTLTRPELRIHTLTLTGVSPELRPGLEKAVARLANHTFSRTEVTGILLAPYRDAGFLQARAGLQATATPAAAQLNLDIAATIVPGDAYRVSSIRFDGSPLLSAESFAATVKLHPGDIASRKSLLETIAPIDAAYRAQGYMDVVVNTTPTLDDAAHTVAYQLSVTPGAQYRLRTVTPLHLNAQQLADFQKGWTMAPGQLYSPAYVSTFLEKNTALRSLSTLSASFKATADPDTHQVDLVITFIPTPTAR